MIIATKRIFQWLHRPGRVLVVSALLVFVWALLDGTLFRIWSLQQEAQKVENRIEELRIETHSLDAQIRQAKNLNFVERQARDRFEMVEEDDLVFVFSNEEPDTFAESP